LKYFFLILLFLATSGAYACRCIEPSLDESFERSESIVKGKIEAIALLPDYGGSISIVKVKKTWKNQTLDTIGIISLTNCSFVFEKNREYVLFIKKDKYGLYSTDKCSGNKLVQNGNKVSDWLDSKDNTLKK